ncbi:histidine kinase-like ATPase [Gigaspora rosea]|uniref:Histidine kinase-like ATPase n=1 Tax=Gigaspora rosea TaxID=44941 RepID=A0A397VL13_9GLOM|nr:histidine kinase-like ATPase [Gigaspora rosea]
MNEKKQKVVLEVSDTGIGIPESALPNIFQCFYQVESQGAFSRIFLYGCEDTGIGLALVKELITLHSRNITVTFVVNQETIFKCWFPTGCEHLLIDQIYKELNNMNIEADEISENDRKYKVLIVDDNNDMRDYLADLLNEFDVYRPCDDQDAIRTLKMFKKLPDLIFSGK